MGVSQGVTKTKSFLRPPERRRSFRTSFATGGMPVVCERGSRLLISKGDALGGHGMFLFTGGEYPIGTVVTLHLGMPRRPLSVQAAVRSARPGGIGLEFVELDDELAQKLRHWISQRNNRTKKTQGLLS